MPFSDFIQKMSQALSSSVQVLIREDELDYLNNPSQDYKNSFFYGSYEFLAMLEGKIGEAPFFKVQSGKIPVWFPYNLFVIEKRSYVNKVYNLKI